MYLCTTVHILAAVHHLPYERVGISLSASASSQHVGILEKLKRTATGVIVVNGFKAAVAFQLVQWALMGSTSASTWSSRVQRELDLW
jgi:hypothetical protein